MESLLVAGTEEDPVFSGVGGGALVDVEEAAFIGLEVDEDDDAGVDTTVIVERRLVVVDTILIEEKDDVDVSKDERSTAVDGEANVATAVGETKTMAELDGNDAGEYTALVSPGSTPPAAFPSSPNARFQEFAACCPA